MTDMSSSASWVFVVAEVGGEVAAPGGLGQHPDLVGELAGLEQPVHEERHQGTVGRLALGGRR